MWTAAGRGPVSPQRVQCEQLLDNRPNSMELESFSAATAFRTARPAYLARCSCVCPDATRELLGSQSVEGRATMHWPRNRNQSEGWLCGVSSPGCIRHPVGQTFWSAPSRALALFAGMASPPGRAQRGTNNTRYQSACCMDLSARNPTLCRSFDEAPMSADLRSRISTRFSRHDLSEVYPFPLPISSAWH
jgi:hypothetical protein